MGMRCCSQFKPYLWPQVSGTEGPFGTSNIQEQLLPFDLSIFKSLHQVEVRPGAAGVQEGLHSIFLLPTLWLGSVCDVGCPDLIIRCCAFVFGSM